MVALRYDAVYLLLQIAHRFLPLSLDLGDHLIIGHVELFRFLFEDFDGQLVDDAPVGDCIFVDGDVEGGDVFLELAV